MRSEDVTGNQDKRLKQPEVVMPVDNRHRSRSRVSQNEGTLHMHQFNLYETQSISPICIRIKSVREEI